jgi:hypothetical protein
MTEPARCYDQGRGGPSHAHPAADGPICPIHADNPVGARS